MTAEPHRADRGLRLRSGVREVVLIVLGVLIALGIDAAWQYRADRIEETTILRAIRTEMAADTGQLRTRIRMHHDIETTVVAILGDPERIGQRVTVPDSVMMTLFRRPTFQPTLSALEAALASGRFELIQNNELRQVLAGWPTFVADAVEDEIEARAVLEAQLLPALFRDSDLVSIQIQHGLLNQDPAHWVWSDSYTEIVLTLEVANHLARRRFFAMEGSGWNLEDLRERLGAVLDRIDIALQ